MADYECRERMQRTQVVLYTWYNERYDGSDNEVADDEVTGQAMIWGRAFDWTLRVVVVCK